MPTLSAHSSSGRVKLYAKARDLLRFEVELKPRDFKRQLGRPPRLDPAGLKEDLQTMAQKPYSKMLQAQRDLVPVESDCFTDSELAVITATAAGRKPDLIGPIIDAWEHLQRFHNRDEKYSDPLNRLSKMEHARHVGRGPGPRSAAWPATSRSGRT